MSKAKQDNALDNLLDKMNRIVLLDPAKCKPNMPAFDYLRKNQRQCDLERLNTSFLYSQRSPCIFLKPKIAKRPEFCIKNDSQLRLHMCTMFSVY